MIERKKRLCAVFKNETQTHSIIIFKPRLQILMTTNDGICSDQGLLVFSVRSVGVFIRSLC